MPLTPEDVQNKRFTVVRFGKSGYDEEEVDTFLDEIETELRRLIADGESLRSAAATAAAAPIPTPEPEPEPAAPPTAAEEPTETALRTLLLAQRTADDAIAQAKAEAERLVTDARARAESIERDAQAEHATKIADLASQRATVESQIAELRDFERDHRTRLRAYLEGQLGELEKFTGADPAGPTTTLRPGAGSNPTSAMGPAPTISDLITPNDSQPEAASEADGPFNAQPPIPLPPHPAASATKSDPAVGIDTDVDAHSDAPSGPPQQADDIADDAKE